MTKLQSRIKSGFAEGRQYALNSHGMPSCLRNTKLWSPEDKAWIRGWFDGAVEYVGKHQVGLFGKQGWYQEDEDDVKVLIRETLFDWGFSKRQSNIIATAYESVWVTGEAISPPPVITFT